MSMQETVLVEVLEDSMKKLSVRIRLQQTDGSYEHQGSGFLYLTDDGKGYVFTAAHVLEKFDENSPVVVQCYPDETDSGSNNPNKYMFSVPMEAVWMCYDGEMPVSGDDKEFDERDVAIIPLPARDWMNGRSKAFLCPPKAAMNRRRGLGYGYPNYNSDDKIVIACSKVNKDIHCEVYTEQAHCVKWICEEKMSYDERHGLSGSLVAMHDANSVILMSVLQNTYKGHDGRVTLGSDLHWIRWMLKKHGVQIRNANLRENRDACKQIGTIAEYLEKDCDESSWRADRGMTLPWKVKDRYIKILERVLGTKLQGWHRSGRHGDTGSDDLRLYGSKEKGIAVGITASVSEAEIGRTLKAYFNGNMDRDYPHIMLMAVTASAEGADIPALPEHVTFAEQDIWDVPRLIREIALLPASRIREIFRELRMQKDTQAVKRPKHELPRVPNPSDHFVHGSRDEDIARLEGLLNEQAANPYVFISGIGGIGKTELAIQLAWYCMPERGAYFLKYMVPDQEERGRKMQGMEKTILNAPFSNHKRGNRTDEEEYREKLGYLTNEYGGALLIIDNFDWPGEEFRKLRGESSFKDLTTSGIQVVFTTRYDQGDKRFHRLEPLEEELLVELLGKGCIDTAVTKEELQELVELVGKHTLAVVLMSRTLEAGNGQCTAEHIRELLTNGPGAFDGFPEIESDQNGSYELDTLVGHLHKLLSPENLSPKEKSILSCMTLLPDQGLDILPVIKSLTRGNKMERNDTLNVLEAKGWLHKNQKNRRVEMKRLLRWICRYELPLDEDLCGSFLDGMWEQYEKKAFYETSWPELAECFENAAMRTGYPDRAAKWKRKADLIRRPPDSSNQVREQEVGI